MEVVFNADEVMEMAEQLERNGARFYRGASERVADPQARIMLLQLSMMEEEHERTFKELRASLNEKEKAPLVCDPEGEALQYLRTWVETRVFFQRTIDLSSMEEILKAAIDAEEDSIVFYVGMKEVVPEGLGKKRIDEIIREEMGHIQLLSNNLLALKKTPQQ
jgi:rubrerythrin